MRKVLVALFAMLIMGLGVYGYAETMNEPVKVIDENENDHSIVIQS